MGKLSLALVAALLAGGALAAESANGVRVPFAETDPYSEEVEGVWWWKGNPHLHTFLSSGSAFPVEAAALYRRHGYHFVVFTDQNTAVPREEVWLSPKKRYATRDKLNAAYAERLRKTFPDLMPLTRKGSDGETEYRVAPFAEMAAKLNEPNRFLVMAGNEVVYRAKDGCNLHGNLINVFEPCRGRLLPDVTTCLGEVVAKHEAIAAKSSANGLSALVLDHPLWISFDVPPAAALANPSLRFVEICNTRDMPWYRPLPPADGFTHDKWWDVVNTTRATWGQPLVYALATDDQHDYEPLYAGTVEKPGFIRVAAPALTPSALVTALCKGNFYASTGVEFDAIRFDRKSNALSVAVRPAPGRQYRILFIGSKRGCDVGVKGTVRWTLSGISGGDRAAGYSQEREVPYYSPEIGITLKEVKGTAGSYAMTDDDLYVRVKVVTDLGVMPEGTAQTQPIAWTQPILNRRTKAKPMAAGKSAGIPENPVRVLFLGDSVSDRDRGRNHVDRLQAKLDAVAPRRISIYNYAIGGDFIARMIDRFHNKPGTWALERYNGIFGPSYDWAFVMLGHNDTRAFSDTDFAKPNMSAEDVRKGYAELISLLKSKGIRRIVLFSNTSSDFERDSRNAEKGLADIRSGKSKAKNVARYGDPKFMEAFNAVLKEFAERDPVVEYADIYTAMKALPDKSELVDEGGVHLTAKGHAYVAEREFEYLTGGR